MQMRKKFSSHVIKNEEAIKVGVKQLLDFIGENSNREGLLETPKRVAKAWAETLYGYDQKPTDVLKIFTSDTDQMVISRNIEYYSFCEHHMLPFFGHVHIAYLPAGKVIGLSKLARLTDIYAKRLQIQERLTNQIARALNKALVPRGVAVIVEGFHTCQAMRGIKKQDATMVTSCMLGAFRDDAVLRDEFLQLLKIGKGA